MGRLSALLTSLALLACAALALSACGSDSADLLPGETASEINSNLDQVRQLADEGDCGGAESAAAAVGEQIEGLGGVDAKLKEALSEGAGRLNEVVSECAAAEPEEAEETEETTAEEPTETEAEERAAEKEAAKEAKQVEKEEKQAEKEADAKEPPAEEKEPPAKEEKEEEEVPPSEESDGGTSSGGVSPSAPAGSG
jgi:septal ring-binding cell division protein DamX